MEFFFNDSNQTKMICENLSKFLNQICILKSKKFKVQTISRKLTITQFKEIRNKNKSF